MHFTEWLKFGKLKLSYSEKKEILLSFIFIFLGIFSVYEFFSYSKSEPKEIALYTFSFGLIFIPYVLFGTSLFKDFLKKKFGSVDSAYFGFSLYLFLTYLLIHYKFFDLKLAVIFFIYFLVPYLILRFLRKGEEKFDFWIFLVLLIIAIPIDLQLLPKDYSFSKLVIVDLTFFLFLIIAGIKDIGYTWNLNLKDLKIAFLGFLAFGVIALPIAIYTNFISFNPTHLSWERILIALMVIFFFVAIPEEFFFRGIIQNLLEKSFKNKTKYAPAISILITSIIFGLSHFYKYDWRYVFLAILGGVITGIVYYQTRKITVSAITHLLTDATWSLLFVTHWKT